MRCSRLLPLALAALAVAACGRIGQKTEAGSIAWTMRDRLTSWGANPADTAKDVWVALHYPEFKAAPGPNAKDSLNAWVRQHLFIAAEGDTTPPSLEGLAAQLIESYKEARLGAPAGEFAPWYYEGEIQVTWDSLDVVSMKSLTSSYNGGPHDYTAIFRGVVDGNSGRRLAVEDLVRPEALDSLRRLGEVSFRAAREIAPDVPLDSEGFEFEGGVFELTTNYGLDRDGLVFFYNSCDVAPCTWGSTEARIGWDQVRPLLRVDGPLGKLATGR